MLSTRICKLRTIWDVGHVYMILWTLHQALRQAFGITGEIKTRFQIALQPW